MLATADRGWILAYQAPSVTRLGSLAELTLTWEDKQWGWGDTILYIIPVPIHNGS